MFTKLNISEFNEMFSIMEKSFPLDEYRPCNEQKALFDNEYYCVYGEKENKKVKGFIAVWDFQDFLYVEHFAVNPEFRNQGIGAGILKKLTDLYNKPACLEVEPPADDMAKRRIGFYERNGFFFNEFPYIQPPISSGKNPIPLRIMSSGKKLTEKEFLNIKHTLYNKVYKCNENDF